MEEHEIKIEWSFRAMDELSDIQAYFADTSSEEKADAFVDELLGIIDSLVANPELHGFCPYAKLQKAGYRCIRHKQYLVVYTLIGNIVRILAIMHGRRNPDDFNDLAE
jgi:plasmid stabilization system protein ParE